MGTTAIAVDYYAGYDFVVFDSESHSIGGFIVQNWDEASTELYLGVRNYAFETPGADFEDLLAILTGARVKF